MPILSQSNAAATLNGMIADLGTNAHVTLYSGTVPAGPDSGLSGNTALVSGTITAWSSSYYNAAASGMSVSGTFSSGSYAPLASGTATFAIGATSGSVEKQQYTVGTSGAEIIVGNTSIQTGVPVSMSLYLTIPSQSV